MREKGDKKKWCDWGEHYFYTSNDEMEYTFEVEGEWILACPRHSADAAYEESRGARLKAVGGVP